MINQSEKQKGGHLKNFKLWLCGGAGTPLFFRPSPTDLTSNTKTKLQRLYRQESPRLIRRHHLTSAQTIALSSVPVPSNESEAPSLSVFSLFLSRKDGGCLLKGGYRTAAVLFEQALAISISIVARAASKRPAGCRINTRLHLWFLEVREALMVHLHAAMLRRNIGVVSGHAVLSAILVLCSLFSFTLALSRRERDNTENLLNWPWLRIVTTGWTSPISLSLTMVRKDHLPIPGVTPRCLNRSKVFSDILQPTSPENTAEECRCCFY